MSSEDMAKYREMFVQEANEHLQAMNRALLQIEKVPSSREDLDAAFRAAHTIKGMAATMGYDQIREVCKAIEDLFDSVRRGEKTLTSEMADFLFRCFDTMQEMVNDSAKVIELSDFFKQLEQFKSASNNGSAPSDHADNSENNTALDNNELGQRSRPLATTEGELSKSSVQNANTQTIRVKLEDLDSLVDLVGEIMIAKMRLDQSGASSNGLESSTEQVSRTLNRLIADLQYHTMKIRLVPLEQIFDRFPRMVRDLSAKLGKEVNLEIQSQGIELDRTVLDGITDPLLHMLRNAVDHGIETPEDREAKGKPRTGTISLIASRVGDKVSIELADDGKGIDLDRLKQKAIERKIISTEVAKSITDQELLALVGTPGLSTAKGVSDVSGRGVGMDVVFRKIEAVSGQVNIETKKDKGTSIIITIPLSLAIIGGLVVKIGSEKYVIPISNVIAIMNIEKGDIQLVNNKRVVTFRNQIVPLLETGRILGVPDYACDLKPNVIVQSKLTAVLIEKNGRPLALAVDSIQSKQDVVIKDLNKAGYASSPTPSTATILPNGSIALILDSTQF